MEMPQKVMVVDGGARGQAIAKKLAGEGCEVFVSPGNPGNEDFATSTHIETTDIERQLKAADYYGIDLTVVGADDPLALGIVDTFMAENRLIFGPTRKQARIEWDRKYAKEFALQNNVPTGQYGHFTDKRAAKDYAASLEFPVFVKDNGLRGGKGVTECGSMSALKKAIGGLDEFVIETKIDGPEASHFAICDGKTQFSVPILVRDHKRVGEADTGLMTGGMGTVGPLTEYNVGEINELGRVFAKPVAQKLGFKGMLFSGLMGYKGSERNLEWNARPGDPEMQVLMALMKSDLLPVLMASIFGELESLPVPKWDLGKTAVCLVLAAQNYPHNPEIGARIHGMGKAKRNYGVDVLQAGTSKKDGHVIVDGGRVLNIVSVADDPVSALDKAYAAAEHIRFGDDKPLYRRDIGQSLLSKS